jgi:uncharacterized membrane protein YbaN (DUF454 family)
MRSRFYSALGWLCIIIGVIGTVLPILQGLLLIGLGVLVLSRHSDRFSRMRGAVARRYPTATKYIDRAQSRAVNTFEFTHRDQ